jgi:predicted phosphodiesterase
VRFAAIADIHGNALALEAVLADIAALGLDQIVNLGDHVSGPLEARRTADLLIAHAIPCIAGDQDRRLVELNRGGGSARLDYQQLEPRHFEWLAGQPATLMLGDEVLLCHGSPKDDAAYWLDRVLNDGSIAARALAEIETDAAGVAASLILCAHTHIPRMVRLTDGRLVVNPGSVGCPGYDGQRPVYHKVETGTPDARYAILERTRSGWSTTFRYVPYDHMPMAELARQNGFPLWASALATGWTS